MSVGFPAAERVFGVHLGQSGGQIRGKYISSAWDFAFRRCVKEETPTVQIDDSVILS